LSLIKELKSAVGLIIPTDKSIIALEQCKAIIPPNYTRCIQYGFPDESLRIMPVDSDKVRRLIFFLRFSILFV